MNLFRSLQNLIKGKNAFFDEEWDACFSLFRKSLAKFNDDERAASLIKTLNEWNRLNLTQKVEQFPSIFLTIKVFLSRKAKLPDLFEESFNDRVLKAIGSHANNERIALLFSTKTVSYTHLTLPTILLV